MKYVINNCPIVKAIYVTSEAQRSQEFGPNDKVKLVHRVVIEVVN